MTDGADTLAVACGQPRNKGKAACSPGDLEMGPETFNRFSALIYDTAGIRLGPEKEALVKARIGKRMRALGMSSCRRYLHFVQSDATGGELVEMLDAICTNVTQFFRESEHFELVKQFVREWEAKGQKRFRIWCAAASTGEEPYSLAITLRESLRDASNALILATDLSTKALATARKGVYSQRRMQHVPPVLVERYFTREASDGCWRYAPKDRIRTLVRFARINLSKPPFPLRGPLDMIFCRNVMIYFDDAVRKRLLDELFRLLKPGGYLIVGHAESLSGMLSSFKPVQPSLYIKR